MRRVIVASVIGTIIEWYDFFLYAASATLVISKLFFPTTEPLVGTLIALSTFAVGFMARPVGAMIFGHFGDRIGRKRVLVVTLLIMGCGTLMIGLMPTYQSIGVAAPVMLVTVRIIQGVAVGGEYGGAVLMVLEHGHRLNRRGLLGSIPNASASAGFLLATGALAVMTAVTTTRQFEAWGWRVPFLASFVLILVGFYIRSRVAESPLFRDADDTERTVRLPIAAMIRRSPRQALVSVATPICVAIAYNTVLVFLMPFAAQETTVAPETLLIVTTIAQAFYIPCILFWGAVSDRVGRRVPMLVGMGGMAGWIFVFFTLVKTGSLVATAVALLVALFFIAAMYGPQAAYLAELFSTEVRYSGVSLAYQLAFAVAGGFTPVAAVFLHASTGSWLPVAALLVVGAAISATAVTLGRAGELESPAPEVAISSKQV